MLAWRSVWLPGSRHQLHRVACRHGAVRAVWRRKDLDPEHGCRIPAPDRGRIALDGDLLFDQRPASNTPPHLRGIGYVFQDGRLFPHLTVAQNLAFGRWMRGIQRMEGHEQHVHRNARYRTASRAPSWKSVWGRKARVAIGRALLLRPRLLLLDEPWLHWIAPGPQKFCPILERLRSESVPMLYVSHDPSEVKRIANNVVVVAGGRAKPSVDGE